MSIRAVLSLALISFLGTAGAPAQQATAARPPSANARVRLDFKGGTLAEYVQQVRAKFDEANIVANIVIDGDSLDTIHVTKAPIRRMSLPQSLMWVTTTVGGRQHGLIVQPSRSAGDSGDVFLLTVAQAAIPRTQPTVDTVSTDHAIDSIPNRPDWAETLRAAVDGRMAKRHPRTGTVELVNSRPKLLRMRGTRLDVQEAEQTLEELERAVRPTMVLPQLQADVQRLRTQVDSLRLQVVYILRRLPPDTTKR